MALEREYRWYRANRLRLLGDGDAHEGKFVVVKGDGDDVLWPLDTYEAALEAGYDRHGLTSFLVQKIERHPPVVHMRDFAIGPGPGPIDGPPTAPGLYWIRTVGVARFRPAEVYSRGGRDGRELAACLLRDPRSGRFAPEDIIAHLPISLAPPPG
jgi:hypothetical protein